MSLMDRGEFGLAEAAEALDLSQRQVRRIQAAYRDRGAEGLVHGSRGRESPRRLSDDFRQRVVKLARERYRGCNQVHLTELLEENEGIVLSRMTVRRILAEVGIASPRTRRPACHRRRRERAASAGMLLQMDGSPHDWLESRGPRMCLQAAVDDASGEVHGAVFRAQEDAAGYLMVLKRVTKQYGVPIAVYHDRHTIFGSTKALSIEAQLQGRRREPSHVGRAFEDLGIRSIRAQTPQAKGRIERLFRTLQDRLVIALRLSNVASLEEANRKLPALIKDFNARFRVAPASPTVAYRPWPVELDRQRVFAFRYLRTVAGDNTISLQDRVVQLECGPGRYTYANRRVEVDERLDGSIAVFYQGIKLALTCAPVATPLLRSRGPSRPTQSVLREPPPPKSPAPATADSKPAHEARVPGPNHPWRHFKTRRAVS
jgi:transposase